MIANEWDEYSLDVVPLDAPKVQRLESKRAFYAGAFSMLCKFRHVGTDEVTEAEGVELLEAMWQECQQFRRDVLEGKA